jgi:predicted methyltransferase
MMRAAILALVMVAVPAAAQTAPKPPTAAEFARRASIMDATINAALTAPDRPVDQRLRDEGRGVESILQAAWPLDDDDFDLSGKRVLDIGSGGAYLALLFSTMVGERGRVDIHNTPGWINQFPGMDPAAQKRWIKRANIGWITEPWNGISGAPDSYDVIVMGQIYHDVLLEGANIPEFNKTLFALLKPGGRVVIEDHNAIDAQPPAQQANLHRISHELTAELFTAAGFRLDDMTLNDSKYDDRRMNVFFPGVRGRTDRFIAVFVKPQS